MAPNTRGKRPADADPGSPVPAKQPRKTRGQTATDAKAKAKPVDSADVTPEPDVKKPAAKKSRSKASVKTEPTEDDDEATAVEPKKTRAAPKRGKAKAEADSGSGQTDAAEADDSKAAPKKGRGKSKVKAEPAEDEQVDDVEPEEEAKAVPAKDVKEAQLAKAGTSQIPLDEGCYLTSYHVYVDPNDSLIYDAALNQTNASGNNNKFYRVQVSLLRR